MSGITTTQIGAIGETTAATHLTIASQGRLSSFEPVADDDGIDLLVFDKATRNAVPIQVKTRLASTAGKSETFQFDVRRATFTETENSFLLAIILDVKSVNIVRAWLIPMSELKSVARNGPKILSITPSAKETSNDRYTPYRQRDMGEVANELMKFFDSSTGSHSGT